MTRSPEVARIVRIFVFYFRDDPPKIGRVEWLRTLCVLQREIAELVRAMGIPTELFARVRELTGQPPVDRHIPALLIADRECGDGCKQGERRHEQQQDTTSERRYHLLSLRRRQRTAAHRALRECALRQQRHEADQRGDCDRAARSHRAPTMLWMRAASGAMSTYRTVAVTNRPTTTVTTIHALS